MAWFLIGTPGHIFLYEPLPFVPPPSPPLCTPASSFMLDVPGVMMSAKLFRLLQPSHCAPAIMNSQPSRRFGVPSLCPPASSSRRGGGGGVPRFKVQSSDCASRPASHVMSGNLSASGSFGGSANFAVTVVKCPLSPTSLRAVPL